MIDGGEMAKKGQRREERELEGWRDVGMEGRVVCLVNQFQANLSNLLLVYVC